MLRFIRTTSSLALLAAMAVFAIAGAVVALALHPEAEPPRDLSPIEQVRASAWLSSHATMRDGYGDIDLDGHADCWIQQRADESRYLNAKLSVWRRCSGEPITFEWWVGMTVLVIPPDLDSPVWLRWIAEQIVGRDAVRCVGIAGCPAPGQSWQWVLDSARRFAAEPGYHGTVAPRWSTGPRAFGGALVLPAVPDGWMQRLRGSQEREPAISVAGARIVIEIGGGPTQPALACGGMTVHAEAGGIVGTDAHGRWIWLFRGLADHGGFHAKRILCREGLVIATTGGNFADVVAIEPATGGWLFDRGNDCCPGATVEHAGDELLWARDYGTVVSLHQLRAWLARPPARRARLIDIAKANRPELAHDGAMAAGMIGRHHPSGELWGESFAPETVDAATRATLRESLPCAGFRIRWSPTAVLAERAGLARWLAMELQASTRRIASVRCMRGQVAIELVTGNDLLESSEPELARETLVVEIDRNRWRVHSAE